MIFAAALSMLASRPRMQPSVSLDIDSPPPLSLLDPQVTRGGRKPEMETEKLGDHKSPITALLIYRDTLLSSDKEGSIRLWDVSDDAQAPRLRCVLRAAAQVNAIAVQSMANILSSVDRKFVCPRSSMLAACLPDALLFSGEEDASLSVWTLAASKVSSNMDNKGRGQERRRDGGWEGKLDAGGVPAGCASVLGRGGRIAVCVDIGFLGNCNQ
jgi:WD40 repeat protein